MASRLLSLRAPTRLASRLTQQQLYTKPLPSHFHTSSAAASEGKSSAVTEDKDEGFLMRWLGPDTCEADPSKVSRWSMVVPAFGTHLAIGSPWAWSVMSDVLSRENGFVVAASSDWSMAQVTVPLSIVFALQGIAAGIAGGWQLKVGPRLAMATAGVCFGAGSMLAGAGIAMHSLPILYLGYGLLGGTGVGLAYTPPVQALIQWFPDRKGIASGLTLAGFGSGALVLTPAFQYLTKKFAVLPEYLGPVGSIATTTSEDGRLFSDIPGETAKEIVLASKGDLAKLTFDALQEGYYVVGSGDTGAAAAMATLGAGYLGLMLASALAIRRPPAGYLPEGYTPPAPVEGEAGGERNVHFDTVLKVPQFTALMGTFFCVATGGMGLFSVAKPMMSEVFSGALPLVVTSAFASGYVLALSAGNLGGRIGWSAVSDIIGRRPTFQMFTMASVPLYASVPFLVRQVVEGGSSLPLYAFIGTTVTAVSFMGGVYAVLPAYESDLFGTKYVGANHGRMMLASSAAALTGPSLIVALRNSSEKAEMQKLLAAIDPTKFQDKFGASINTAEELINAKTLTISKLMDIAPEDYVDPSPFIYDSTMYTMAGLMACAAVSHHFVKQPADKYMEKVSGDDITDK